MGIFEVSFHQRGFATDEKSVRGMLWKLEIQFIQSLLGCLTEGRITIKRVRYGISLLKENTL
jgi:hypothetical protein